MKPTVKPGNPNFSSGPCSKRPGYNLAALDTRVLGRSHRSTQGKAMLEVAIIKTKLLLEIPADYMVGIVPASDTGAMEMAMWSLLGPRPVDVFAWESFGAGWLSDIKQQLKLEQVNGYTAEYGQLPDLGQADPSHDVVFTWNGTTSGVRVPNVDWISDDRSGLTLCDATSAVFAQAIDWHKLDVTTFSWQKALGGEGAHGVIVLSPRAIERLLSYQPPWPMPKIFRLTKKGQLDSGIFSGATINTPSMLCVADYLDALDWLQREGGLQAGIGRSDANLAVIDAFVEKHPWISFLAESDAIRSNTSVCLTLACTAEQTKRIVSLLEQEQVAYDIGAYRDAPAGIRIWCGATVERADVEALMPWLEYAFLCVTEGRCAQVIPLEQDEHDVNEGIEDTVEVNL